MVYCWMVPGTVLQHNYLVHWGGYGGVAKGGRDDFCERIQLEPGENGRTVTGQGDWCGGGDGGDWGHLHTIPPATESVEFISENVSGGETGEGDEVPDGLYSGFRSSDLSERGCPGPTTQLQPLHGHRVSTRRLPKGSLILPWAQDRPPSLSDWTSDKDTVKQYFCGV